MVARPVTQSAVTWFSRLVEAERSGNVVNVQRILQSALAERHTDANLFNEGGNILLRLGDATSAAQWFDKALRAEPARLDFAINTAIALSSSEEHRAALECLLPFEKVGKASARYCSTRAKAYRGIRSLGEAAFWYDLALRLEPSRKIALHGRARTALERGEGDAVAWFDRALIENSGDPHLWLGKAQALAAAGEAESAREIAESLARQVPQMIDALAFLAQLRREAGEENFADHYDAAARAVPGDFTIVEAHLGLLAACEEYEKAAILAEQGSKRFSGHQLKCLQAGFLSASGKLEDATRIFSALDDWSHPCSLEKSRHALRCGDPKYAAALLDAVLKEDRWNQQAWALRLITWRLNHDARISWLLQDGALTQPVFLSDAEEIIGQTREVLDKLHDHSPFPVGQSLRGGTQTRGNLFDRFEEPIHRLKNAVETTFESWREALPPYDPDHPFLRQRNAVWQLEGSWSVRLQEGGDYHASHIHPQGLVSSALYLRVPDAVETDSDQAGWLELGRPPKDLECDLAPIAMIQPRVGLCALFPSFLYHGTRPFSAGGRMSVAFDISTLRHEPR